MRFPAVPAEPFTTRDEAAAGRALEAIGAWRGAVTTWLGGPAQHDSVSPTLAATLLERLAGFPGSTGDGACADLRAILLWRAGIVDFLADAWDTIGPSGYGVEECRRMEALFDPERPTDTCGLCLSALPESPRDRARHYESCAVQRAWQE